VVHASFNGYGDNGVADNAQLIWQPSKALQEARDKKHAKSDIATGSEHNFCASYKEDRSLWAGNSQYISIETLRNEST
tara:strand:- start:683 stop:916 length:234 start_codon:yes stop_codon:yes gene_type:complete